jgi:hypothetical protein
LKPCNFSISDHQKGIEKKIQNQLAMHACVVSNVSSCDDIWTKIRSLALL